MKESRTIRDQVTEKEREREMAKLTTECTVHPDKDIKCKRFEILVDLNNIQHSRALQLNERKLYRQ